MLVQEAFLSVESATEGKGVRRHDGTCPHKSFRTPTAAGLACSSVEENGGTMSLYTKNGKPLQVSGNTVYSRSGTVVGRIRGEKVYGTDGCYVGTITNGRLVYRSTDSATIGSSFSVANCAGTGLANSAALAVWGDEPDIPD